MPVGIAGRSFRSFRRKIETNALGTPTWLPVSPSDLPGVTTRPVMRVGLAGAHCGTSSHSGQSGGALPAHTVGLPLFPPEQIWKALQVRPSVAQSNVCPQLL